MAEIDQLAAAQNETAIGLGSRLGHGVAWLRAAHNPKTGLVLRHELAYQALNHTIHSLAGNILLNERISSTRSGLKFFAIDSELAPKIDGFRWSYPPTTNNLDPSEIDEAVGRCLATKYNGRIPEWVRNYFKKKPTRLSGIPDGLCSNDDAEDCLAAEEQKLAALGAVDHLALTVTDSFVGESSVKVEVSLDPTISKPKLSCDASDLFAKYTVQILEGMIVFKHAVTIFTQGDRSVVVVWKEPNVLRVSYVIHHTENGVQSSAQDGQSAPAFSKSMSLAILKAKVAIYAAAKRLPPPSIKH
ncbi:hypothetical protein JCM24511_04845 [Saitozyma sp. JCM 24511]|nr:hypothetical protein JCM24511_04845 [Saitozyma sp. JCM 24511]